MSNQIQASGVRVFAISLHDIFVHFYDINRIQFFIIFRRKRRKTYSEKRIIYSKGYEYFYYSNSCQIHLDESCQTTLPLKQGPKAGPKGRSLILMTRGLLFQIIHNTETEATKHGHHEQQKGWHYNAREFHCPDGTRAHLPHACAIFLLDKMLFFILHHYNLYVCLYILRCSEVQVNIPSPLPCVAPPPPPPVA